MYYLQNHWLEKAVCKRINILNREYVGRALSQLPQEEIGKIVGPNFYWGVRVTPDDIAESFHVYVQWGWLPHNQIPGQ